MSRALTILCQAAAVMSVGGALGYATGIVISQVFHVLIPIFTGH